MSKSKDRFKEILLEACELYFTAEAQNPEPGNFHDEIETLAAFRAAAEEFIQVTENQLDNSWREISGKKRLDSEKIRLHEVFAASFGRFKTAFEKIEDVQNCLQDYGNDDHS